MATQRIVRELASSPPCRVQDVGQGAPGADACQEAVLARGVGGPDRGVVARALRPAGRAARAAAPDPGARRRPPGLVPRPAAVVGPGRRRAAPPELARGGGLRAARA